MIGRVLVDVAFNAALAFGLSALLVAAVLRAARRHAIVAGGGSLQVGLLLLPFLKACLELVRGVPDGAFLWAFARGVEQDMGTFRVGIGLTGGRVLAQGMLAAVAGGRSYPTSAGELLVRGLVKAGAGWAIEVLGFGCAAVSLALIARRVAGAVRFERARRRARSAATSLDALRAGRRSVDVYVSEAHAGAPFAGGLLRPYVCFPAAAYAALSQEEQRAVLGHELAHIRRFDVAWLTLLSLLSDVLWFCPGVGWLARRIASAVEHAADERAVEGGVRGAVLASAIVRVAQHAAENAAGGERGACTSFAAVFGARQRILALLRRNQRRATWPGRIARLAIWAVTANVVIFAVFFGNHG